MLIKRDLEFEKALAEKLLSVDWTKLDTWDRALLLNGAAKVWAATGSEEFGNILVEGLKKCGCVLADSDIAAQEDRMVTGSDSQDLCNYMLGNACYAAKDFTGEPVYAESAKKLAEQFNTQKRGEAGYFLNKEHGACLCDTYCSQVFYMNYETRDGGKEHYNDIIAQYNSIHESLYRDVASKADLSNCRNDKNTCGCGGEAVSDIKEACELLSYYCAALIDTMEVMDQALYEIYRKLQDYFKEAVKTVLKVKYSGDADAFSGDGTAESYELIFAYAVFKGCRMKALQTEKYEYAADMLYNKMPEIASVSFDSADGATLVGACALVYSEAVRNREYQDYGRGKGGVLWS